MGIPAHARVLARVPAPQRESIALAMLLALGFFLWMLAYQVEFRAHLAIGGDVSTHRRRDDIPFLKGFNSSEPSEEQTWQWWTLEPGYGYRWTSSNASLHLPGVGGKQWILSLLASSGRPDNTATRSTWQVGKHKLPTVTLPASHRIYHVLVHPDATGDIALHLDTEPYVTTHDPRDLGFVLRDVRLAPTEHSIHTPALAQTGWLTLILVLLYVLSRWLVFRVQGAFVFALACAGVLALLLATHRLALTVFTPIMAAVLLSCLGIAALMWGIVRIATRPPPFALHTLHALRLPVATIKPAIALVVLAFAIRLGGMLHPHAIPNDHLMNANNVLDVGWGQIYFTQGLPSEAGGGEAPYPPGTYLIAMPVQLFAPSHIESRVIVIQSSVALLDSLVVGGLWLLLRHSGIRARAALMGAALYVAPAPLLKSFSIGEYANIGGQALAIPAIICLALAYYQRYERDCPPTKKPASSQKAGPSTLQSAGTTTQARVQTRTHAEQPETHHTMLCFIVLLCIGVLGHMGVAISLTLFIATLWLATLLLLRGDRSRHGAKTNRHHLTQPGMLLLSSGVAAIIVAGIYYSAPLFQSLIAQRLTDTTATSTMPAPSPFEALLATMLHTLSPSSSTPPILLVSGVVGLLLLWQIPSSPLPGNVRCSPAGKGLRLVLLAWFVSTLLSLGLLLIARQGVRWQHFLYPALCAGAAPALAHLWQRGIAGRLVAGASIGLPAAHGLIVWVTQIRDYWH